ncbi:MAG: cation transporter, partial [Fibrobacter sp.]|nr:cation transporter [Fibrobacter sp.]
MGSKSGSGRELLVQRVVNAGLFSNVLLSLMKVIIGIAAGSRALLADGINSTSDVAYYVLVKIFTRLASKPADAEHPYGHQQ